MLEENKSIVKIALPILFILLIILLVVFSPGTFAWIKDAFKPVMYALILAYLLDSLVTFFVRKLKVRRIQGIFLACVILIGIISFLIYMAVPKILENINNIVYFIMEGNVDIAQILVDLGNKIDNGYVHYFTEHILQASESVRNLLNKYLVRVSNLLMRVLTNIGASTITIISSFIINIYMLSEKEDILARGKRFIYAYCGDKNSNRILNTFTQANNIFKSFLNGKLLDSTIVGILCVIAFYIFEVPYAPLMGTIIGVFNIIPYFGPIIGSIPVILVSFFVDPQKLITAIIIIIVIQQIDANILDPRIVGENIGVSPFWIITSVTISGNLFGVPGMILGVPVVVLIKTIVEESVNMRLIEKGIGDIEKNKLRDNKKKKFKKPAK